MSGQTARHKLPFPESSDAVQQGATIIENLATKLDNEMGPNVVVRQDFTNNRTAYAWNGTAWSGMTVSFDCVENQTFLLHFNAIVRNPSGSIKNCYMPYKWEINNVFYRQTGVNPPNLQYATINHTEAWVADFTGTCYAKIWVKSENGAILHNKSTWHPPTVLVIRL